MTDKAEKKIKLEYTRTNNSSGNVCLKYDEVYVIVKAGSKFEENSNVNAPTETIARLAQFNDHSEQGCFVDNQGNFTSSKVTALSNDESEQDTKDAALSNDESENEDDSAILRIFIPDRPIRYYLSIWGYGRSNNRLYGPFFHEIDNSSSNRGKTPYADIKVTNLRRYSSEYSREILYDKQNKDSDINTLQFSYFVALPESEKIYFQELPKRICIVYKKGTPVLYLYGEDLITLYKHTEEQMSESDTGEQIPKPEEGPYLDILSIPYIFFSPLINKQFEENARNEENARKLTNDENLIDTDDYKYFNPFGNSSNLKFIMDEAFTEDENGYTLWVGSYDPSSFSNPSLLEFDEPNGEDAVDFDIDIIPSSRIVISGNPSVKSGARFTKALGNYNSSKRDVDPNYKDVEVKSTALSCVLNTYDSSESELVLTLASTKDFINENNNENSYLNISAEEKRFLSVKNSAGGIIQFPIFNFHTEEFYGVTGGDKIILTNQDGTPETIDYNSSIGGNQLQKIKEGELNGDTYDIKIKKSNDNEYPLVQQIENSFYFYSPYPLENDASFTLTKEDGEEVSSDYDLTIIFSDEDSQNVDQVVYEAVNQVDGTGSQAINSFSKEMTAELENIEGLVIFFSQTEFSLSKKQIENFEIEEQGNAIPKFNYFYSVRRPETWPISNISINGKSSSQIAKKDILCRYYIQDFNTMNFQNNSLTIPIEEAENWKKMYAIIATFSQSALDSNFKNQAPYLIEFPMYSNLKLNNPNIGISTRNSWNNGHNRVTKNKRLAYVDKNNKLKYWKQHIFRNSNAYKSLEEQEVAILEENNNKILYFYVPTILSDRSLVYSIPAPENSDYTSLGDEKEVYWRYMFDDNTFDISEDYNADNPLKNGLYSISLGNAEYGEQKLAFDLEKKSKGGDPEEMVYKATFNKDGSTGIVNKEDLGNTFEITNVQGQTATVKLGDASMQIQKIEKNKESLKLGYVTEKIINQDRYHSISIDVQSQED